MKAKRPKWQRNIWRRRTLRRARQRQIAELREINYNVLKDWWIERMEGDLGFTSDATAYLVEVRP